MTRAKVKNKLRCTQIDQFKTTDLTAEIKNLDQNSTVQNFLKGSSLTVGLNHANGKSIKKDRRISQPYQQILAFPKLRYHS